MEPWSTKKEEWVDKFVLGTDRSQKEGEYTSPLLLMLSVQMNIVPNCLSFPHVTDQ